MAEGPGSALKVFPPPGGEVPEIYGGLEFPSGSPVDPSLPYVAINMVASIDGKASSGGKSGSIGGEADRAAMRALRSKVDAVMVGAGTLRAEKVSLTSEGRRRPEPKAVLATSTLDLPMGNLLNAERGGTLVLVPESALRMRRREIRSLERFAEVVPANASPEGRIDFRAALAALKEGHGIEKLLLEGGPGINHGFISSGLVSEIFLTVAPKLIGGPPEESVGTLSGPRVQTSQSLSLVSTYISNPVGEVFLRYKLRPRQ